MKAQVLAVSLRCLAIGAMVFAASSGRSEESSGKVSVWTGVYTQAQSKRGAEVHESACASCHGSRLNGAGQPDMPPSPAIAREGFLRKWAGKSVAELFSYVHTKMPPDNPGTLSPQQSIDAIAHMLQVSNVPAGEKELPSEPNVLDNFLIETQPKK
jgi:cytochrome c